MSLQPKSVARDLDRQWSQVQDMLRAEFGETAYSTWLAPLTLDGFEGERVLLSCPPASCATGSRPTTPTASACSGGASIPRSAAWRSM